MSVFALHGQDELVAMGGEGLLVVALTEVGAAQVTVRPALASDVPQGLGHGQVLLHVGHRLQERRNPLVVKTCEIEFFRLTFSVI